MESHTATPAQLQRRIALEAAGEPFVTFGGPEGEEQVVLRAPRVTVGRGPEVDVGLDGDPEVSRLHATLEWLGGAWVLCDDGLSQNGSFVGDERVEGRRRLRDGDVLRFGATDVRFCAPGTDEPAATRPAERAAPPPLSPNQRLVLVALCRPYRDRDPYARPATNRQIADDACLSADAVKTHLRALFEKFGLGDLPQNEKRLRLVEAALRGGAVSRREL